MQSALLYIVFQKTSNIPTNSQHQRQQRQQQQQTANNVLLSSQRNKISHTTCFPAAVFFHFFFADPILHYAFAVRYVRASVSRIISHGVGVHISGTSC